MRFRPDHDVRRRAPGFSSKSVLQIASSNRFCCGVRRGVLDASRPDASSSLARRGCLGLYLGERLGSDKAELGRMLRHRQAVGRENQAAPSLSSCVNGSSRQM